MIQIYTGDGKGKTTAAVGQCIRAAGNHMQVFFVQFLKDGTSGEIQVLQRIPGVSVSFVEHSYGFYKNMTDTEKMLAQQAYGELLDDAIQTVMNQREKRDNTESESNKVTILLVLDEVIAAYHHELIRKDHLIHFLKEKSPRIEVILTGRSPDKELIVLADYVTEMKKIKHPFDRGIQARNGIEY